jgi:two-component system cell cycle response regulator
MAESQPSTQVLIADDSPVVLHMLETMFRGTGFEVLTAKDGIEAVEKAFAHDVSLIILDVMMPRLNGYQTCRLLKSDSQTKDIPVIILTSKDQAGDRFWGLETGAAHYLTKDEAPQRLLELVAGTLAEWKSRAPRVSARRHTSVDILSRVNDLLDRQLYEAIVLSEIGRVARHLVQFDETVTSVMGLVARMVDFALGAVGFVDGDELEAVLVLNHAVVPDGVDVMRRRLLEAANRHCGPLPVREVRTRLLTIRAATEESHAEDPLEDLAAFPVVTNERLVGLLVVAGRSVARLTPETETLMARVANQAHIVVENSRLVERLRNLSIRDGLTDLYNHRHIMETLANEFARIGRYESFASVLMIDIDHFKRVNDSHGHQVGDSVLHGVARLLVGALRSVDVVGRYGGEEFMAVLPQTRYEEAVRTAQRIRRMIHDHTFTVGGKPLAITVSVGVATYPGAGIASASDLINACDQALYRAKANGRDAVAGALELGGEGATAPEPKER